MSGETHPRCPQCGKPHGGEPGEPCAACLLRLGLESDDQTTVDSTAGDVASEPEAGESGPMPARIGDWRPIRQLGEGGMGIVYLAEDLGPLERKGALKRIKHGLDSKRVLERFDQERRVLAKMDHPGIARAIDAGAAVDGTPYFVMEYVDGIPITDYCDRQRLDTRSRLSLFAKLCDAVDHAHRRGILHRDLKPSNILIVESADGPHPKVIDFGIARAIARHRLEWSVFTEFGRLIGTPEYMSPEQADLENDDLDTRSDVYGLGAVLYELLVGRTPHNPETLRAKGLQGLLKTIREGTFPTPSSRLSTLGDEAGVIAECRDSDPERLRRGIAGELDWIVMRATERDRERRYGSPREFGEDVQRFLENQPIVAGPPGAAYRMRKFVRRHRVGVSAAAAVLAGLVIFAGTMTWQARVIAKERDRARQEADTAERVSNLLVGIFESADPFAETDQPLTARDLLARGVEQSRRSLADQPEIRARMFSSMGRALAGLGETEQAEALYLDAYEIYRETGGADDDRATDALLAMARMAWTQRDIDEALSRYERLIEAQRTQRGAEDEQTLAIELEVPAMFILNNRFDEAMTRLDELYPRLDAALGPDDFLTLLARSHMAFVQAHSGKKDEANIHIVAALKGMSLDEREYDPWSTMYFQRMGWTCIALNRFDDAQAVFADVIAHFESHLGPDHPDSINSRRQTADVYYQQGNYEESARILGEALEDYRRVLGNDHANTRAVVSYYADSCYHAGRYDEAETTFRDLLDNMKATEANSFRIFRASFGLANTLNRLGRYTEALPLHRKCAAYCEANFPPSFPLCRDVGKELEQALQATGG